MKQYILFLAVLFALFSPSHFSAFAGGSYDEVQINSIKMLSETDYVLIVTPMEESSVSYMKHCLVFEVHGGYHRPKGSLFF